MLSANSACMRWRIGRRAGWPEPLPYIAKYAFQYLFVQAEFGLMCPISVTDTGAVLVENYGSDDLKSRYLGRMLSQNMDEIFKGAQYMTERAGGSDLGNSAVGCEARGRFLAALRRQVVLLRGQRRRGVATRAARRGAAGSTRARALPDAATIGKRRAQQLSNRAAQGQIRHALDGERRSRARGRNRVPARRARSRPAPDDGHGESQPHVARRARGGHDAPMPQRVAPGCAIIAPRSAGRSSSIPCCGAS